MPDSVHWVTGTIAKSIARFNPWIEATIASGPVIDIIFAEQPGLINNFDLVHFTCPYASREWMPRFREHVPCVTSHHHVTDWEWIKHNAEGDAIIVGSPEWREDLRARGVDTGRVFCVPYGVDATLFKPPTTEQKAAVRKRLGIKSHSSVVGFFGKNSSNDDDRKGIDTFTKAILSLKDRVPALAVLIVGPGWQDLSQTLNSVGVQCISIPFVQELRDLGELYHALDFYWVTARVEGGPVTLLEAMSTEVCCLTTAVGLARELVEDGVNAVLLPFNDSEAFAERTAALASNDRERGLLGRNARITILEKMHVGITAPGVVEVYAKAFENSAARRQVPQTIDVHQLANSTKALELPKSVYPEIPLHGIPSSMRPRIKMLESLAFSEHLLLYHNQRGVALRMILREWIANPLSSLPIRVLLRRMLPAGLVARIVKLKNRSNSTPELVTHH